MGPGCTGGQGARPGSKGIRKEVGGRRHNRDGAGSGAAQKTAGPQEIMRTSHDCMAAQLEQLGALEEFANTKVLQDLPQLEPKLSPFVTEHYDAQESHHGVSQKAMDFVTSYNDIMTMLSKKFLYWDQLLTAAEQQVISKTNAVD